MRITWQQRLAANAEYRDIAAWPFIDSDTLPVAQRTRFLRNRRIVAQVLAGLPQRDIAAAHQVERSRISRLMERCLGGDDASDPALTYGLIPFVHLQTSERRTALSTLQKPAGARGAFSALLAQLPAVQDSLERVIRASVQRRADGQQVQPKALHREFLRLLRDAQWPSDRYPFTEKSQGYESLRHYWHQRSDALRMPHRKKPRIIRPLTTQLRVYDELQIDEQLFDAQGRIDLVIDNQHEPLRVGRISLACIVDKVSDCRLGFQTYLTKHPSQFDLLALLYQLHAPWQRMELITPGLSYAPGACLPTALGFPFTHAGPGIVRFDNAFSHSAHSVRDYICDRLSATLELGLIAQPKSRHDVEHAFALVSQEALRFASATGSHPHDPAREARKHRDKPPRVTLRALEEALSVILTQHNVTPQARLGGRSPLEVLRYQMEQGWPRRLPDHTVAQRNPFIQRRTAAVHWYKHEKRCPHVNFEYLRYYGHCLSDPALANSAITLEYDIRDIRQVTAIDKQGRTLGTLLAPQSWQHYPHSITTRRRIHDMTKSARLAMRDPLGEYFAYMLRHRELPSQALELVRVYREFNRNAVLLFNEPHPVPFDEPAAETSSRTSHLAIPDWHPALVRRGSAV